MEPAIELSALTEIVITAAREELLPRYAQVAHSHKRDGSILTEADMAMQTRIAGQLQALSAETAFLGEEMQADEQARLLATDTPVWCLDPLDGTRNFAAGIPCFSVSLALLRAGRAELGLVYDPLRDECFSARLGQGAWLDGQPLTVPTSGLTLKQATAIIDFKRLEPGLATRLATEIPYASQRSFGSVALDWCWLAAGRGHLYLHGRSQIWDYAAGNLVFTEAGGHSVSLDGKPVFTRSLVPRSAVAAVDPALFSAWCDWLGIDLQ